MFKDSTPTLLAKDKASPPFSWEMNLPDHCDDPDQAKKLYHNAHSWIEELRSKTEPPAYPLRTLMNVVNVADLLRDKHPWRTRRLENKLKRLSRHPDRLSGGISPRSLGRVVLAINRFYHPKTGTAPAKTIMEQFNQQNLPIRDDIILNQLSGSGSQRLTLEEVRQQARQAVETKLDPKTIQTIYHRPTDIDK